MEIGKQKNGEVKSPLQAKGEQRRAGLKPGPYRRAFGAKCLEVFHAGVAQDGDDSGARSQLFGDAQSGHEVGAAGNSGEEALFASQPQGHGLRLFGSARVEEVAARVGYADGATLRTLLRRRLNLGVREIRRTPWTERPD